MAEPTSYGHAPRSGSKRKRHVFRTSDRKAGNTDLRQSHRHQAKALLDSTKPVESQQQGLDTAPAVFQSRLETATNQMRKMLSGEINFLASGPPQRKRELLAWAELFERQTASVLRRSDLVEDFQWLFGKLCILHNTRTRKAHLKYELRSQQRSWIALPRRLGVWTRPPFKQDDFTRCWTCGLPMNQPAGSGELDFCASCQPPIESEQLRLGKWNPQQKSAARQTMYLGNGMLQEDRPTTPALKIPNSTFTEMIATVGTLATRESQFLSMSGADRKQTLLRFLEVYDREQAATTQPKELLDVFKVLFVQARGHHDRADIGLEHDLNGMPLDKRGWHLIAPPQNWLEILQACQSVTGKTIKISLTFYHHRKRMRALEQRHGQSESQICDIDAVASAGSAQEEQAPPSECRRIGNADDTQQVGMIKDLGKPQESSGNGGRRHFEMPEAYSTGWAICVRDTLEAAERNLLPSFKQMIQEPLRAGQLYVYRRSSGRTRATQHALTSYSPQLASRPGFVNAARGFEDEDTSSPQKSSSQSALQSSSIGAEGEANVFGKAGKGNTPPANHDLALPSSVKVPPLFADSARPGPRAELTRSVARTALSTCPASKRNGNQLVTAPASTANSAPSKSSLGIKRGSSMLDDNTSDFEDQQPVRKKAKPQEADSTQVTDQIVPILQEHGGQMQCPDVRSIISGRLWKTVSEQTFRDAVHIQQDLETVELVQRGYGFDIQLRGSVEDMALQPGVPNMQSSSAQVNQYQGEGTIGHRTTSVGDTNVSTIIDENGDESDAPVPDEFDFVKDPTAESCTPAPVFDTKQAAMDQEESAAEPSTTHRPNVDSLQPGADRMRLDDGDERSEAPVSAMRPPQHIQDKAEDSNRTVLGAFQTHTPAVNHRKPAAKNHAAPRHTRFEDNTATQRRGQPAIGNNTLALATTNLATNTGRWSGPPVPPLVPNIPPRGPRRSQAMMQPIRRQRGGASRDGPTAGNPTAETKLSNEVFMALLLTELFVSDGTMPFHGLQRVVSQKYNLEVDGLSYGTAVRILDRRGLVQVIGEPPETIRLIAEDGEGSESDSDSLLLEDRGELDVTAAAQRQLDRGSTPAARSVDPPQRRGGTASPGPLADGNKGTRRGDASYCSSAMLPSTSRASGRASNSRGTRKAHFSRSTKTHTSTNPSMAYETGASRGDLRLEPFLTRETTGYQPNAQGIPHTIAAPTPLPGYLTAATMPTPFCAPTAVMYDETQFPQSRSPPNGVLQQLQPLTSQAHWQGYPSNSPQPPHMPTAAAASLQRPSAGAATQLTAQPHRDAVVTAPYGTVMTTQQFHAEGGRRRNEAESEVRIQPAESQESLFVSADESGDDEGE